MAFIKQSSSVLAKYQSGGGANFGVPGGWGQAAYGSGFPIQPVSMPKDIDIPREIDYPIASNSQITPRVSYGLMPFAALLEAYENVAEVKAPVSLIHRELNGFIPKLVDEQGNAVEDHPYGWMLTYPDRKTPFSVWLTRFIKSAKVYDAPAVYLNQGKDGIDALHYIDGSTLFLIIDQYGNTPDPEPVYDYVSRMTQQGGSSTIPVLSDGGTSTINEFVQRYIQRQREGKSVPTKIPAYTQIIKGTPFSWWSSDQIWYMPQSRRLNAPYGESFIEQAWFWIMIIVNITAFELGHYRTGNMPEGFVTVGKDWFNSPDAVLAAELLFNQRMTSNPVTERNRIRVFPDGTKYTATKKPDFPLDLYDQANKNILHAIGVPPSEMGDIPGGGLGGKGFKEESASEFGRHTINPNRAFIASMFNYVLDRDDVDDVRFSLDYPTEEIDADKLKQSAFDGMAHGTLTLNDALGQLNLPPVAGSMVDTGDGAQKPNPEHIANKHLIVAGSTIFVVEDMDVQNGMAVPSFTGQQTGGATGGAPVSPETAAEQAGAEHTQEDNKTLQEAIRNIQESGTLSNKFISIPSGIQLTKAITEPDKPADDGKIEQSDAGYTAVAMNTNERCELCKYFIEGGRCNLVKGDIEPGGWCKLFEAKGGNEPTKPETPPEPEPADKIQTLNGVGSIADEYFGAPISRETELIFPANHHANDVEIVAITPDGLPAQPALWKPEGGENISLNEYIGGAQFVREEATYLLDRSLGFYLVPVAYISESNGEHGAVVMYIPGSEKGKPANEYAPEWIERAAVLDYISGQVDRGDNGHNYITSPDDEMRPVLFDNGLTFPVNPEIQPNSGFIAAWNNQSLSDTTKAALILCNGDASLWADLIKLVGTEATQNARLRLNSFLTVKVAKYEGQPRAEGGRFGEGKQPGGDAPAGEKPERGKDEKRPENVAGIKNGVKVGAANEKQWPKDKINIVQTSEDELRRGGIENIHDYLGAAGLNEFNSDTLGVPLSAKVQATYDAEGRVSRLFVSATDGKDVEINRTFYFNAGKPDYITNNTFFLSEGQQGKGIGTKTLYSQTQTAKEMGFRSILTDAGRAPGVNGYYTWPRLGYDGTVDGPGGRIRLSDLMATKEGRDWWKGNGLPMTMRFDLSEGSASHRILEEYIKGKKQ